MSDERDETRPFTPPATGDDETIVSRPPTSDDATQVGGFPAGDDETMVDPVRPRPDATAVMPPAGDDWAPSRGNTVWSGRAEVRPPQPGVYQEVVEDWPETMGGEPRRHWWAPIVVGLIALVLLAALGWGIYMIVQDTGGNETPAPTAPPSVAPTQTTTSTPSTPPSTQPTTTEPSLTPSTTDPATTEVTVPALKGLPLPAAEVALSNMNLRWHVLYREDDALPGTVIDSDPAEGQEVPPDTRITLVVAQGDAPPPSGPTTASTDVPGVDGD